MAVVKNEPVVTSTVAMIVSACAMLVGFGVELSSVQIALIVEFIQSALALAFLVRSQVTPKARLAITRPVVLSQEQIPS